MHVTDQPWAKEDAQKTYIKCTCVETQLKSHTFLILQLRTTAL